MRGTLDHERLKALSRQLGRPLSTLYALSGANDPFVAGQPARRAAAEWFAEVWNDLGVARLPPAPHPLRRHVAGPADPDAQRRAVHQHRRVRRLPQPCRARRPPSRPRRSGGPRRPQERGARHLSSGRERRASQHRLHAQRPHVRLGADHAAGALLPPLAAVAADDRAAVPRRGVVREVDDERRPDAARRVLRRQHRHRHGGAVSDPLSAARAAGAGERQARSHPLCVGL